MPFIVFEGIDRSGKTTQCRLLIEHLQQIHGVEKILPLRYPDRNSPAMGSLVNGFLAGTTPLSLSAASLLFLANLWEIKDKLQAALADNRWVIMDRYVWSNIAYSAARGMDRMVAEALCEGLPTPDMTLLMEATPEIVSQRGDFGLEIFDTVEFQRKVVNVMKILGQEGRFAGHIEHIDASRSVEEIHQEIIGVIKKAQLVALHN